MHKAYATPLVGQSLLPVFMPAVWFLFFPKRKQTNTKEK